MPRIVGFEIAVTRPPGTDKFGNPLTAPDPHTVADCIAAPSGSTELVNGQNTVIDHDTIYAAFDADITAADLVDVPSGQAIEAGRYVVDGTPQRWPSAFGNAPFGCVIRLTRVTG